MDWGPRRMIAGAVPGRPEADTMLAPATLPCSCESGLEPGTGMSFSLTCATENASFFCSVPAVTPVVTTSCSRLMSLASVKSNV